MRGLFLYVKKGALRTENERYWQQRSFTVDAGWERQ